MHSQLIASILQDKGFPIYQVRPDAVLVKFARRSVSSIELMIALDDEIEAGLVSVDIFCGVGKVTINE